MSIYKKLPDFYNFTEVGFFANLNNFTMLPLTGYSQNVPLIDVKNSSRYFAIFLTRFSKFLFLLFINLSTKEFWHPHGKWKLEFDFRFSHGLTISFNTLLIYICFTILI